MTIQVHTTESGVGYIDATAGEVSVTTLEPVVNKLGREIANWMQEVQGRVGGRQIGPSLINRQGYAGPGTPYASMHLAYQAVDNDDVVGGVADVTEGLMFQGLGWESDDINETDVFNQIARDLNLDQLARQWHREEFIYSQVIMGVWWGRRSYTARTTTSVPIDPQTGQKPIDPATGKPKKGKKSKKKYLVTTPVALTFLDPRRVVPLQPGPFGQDRLAWAATKDEYTDYMLSWQTGSYGDALMREFMNGPANVDPVERAYLGDLGVRFPEYLIMLNPASVVRFCRTKSHYERFPMIRLKSTFPLLDLKQQLMEADRVTLVGTANYILLVRQGSKEQPATQPEIDNLQENFKVVAKIPVVTGDHRLQIDIITPKADHTLETGRYDTLDRRIISRALGALTVASSGQRNESSLTIARGIGRLLESRRQMFRRFMEEHIARAIVEHPENAGLFDSEPNLAFTPRNIQLDSDQEFLQSVLAMRTMNEISRQSLLETFGFDQAVEAMRREIEEEVYDDVFQTHVPFDSPTGNPGDPNQPNQNQQGGQNGQGAEGSSEPSKVSGARGGRPKGGGSSPQSKGTPNGS